MATISACMIVKDAEEHLERCLNSLQDIVDEIIVVDTGSSDKTVEIAQRFGAELKEYSWTNDFSAARNESLQHATKEWVLIIDDDEAFDKRELAQLKSKLDEIKGDAIILSKKNFTNERNMQGWVASNEAGGFEGYFISKRVQLFRNKKGIKFSYKLHETVMPSLNHMKARVIEVTDVFLLHYGYNPIRDSYVELVEEEMEKQGGDIKVLYEAGVIFLNQGMYDKAIESFMKVKVINPRYLSVLNNLGAAYTKKGQFFEAAQAYLGAIDQDEKNITGYNNLAVMFRKIKKYDKAEALLKKALQIQRDPRLFSLLALVYQDQDNKENMKKAVVMGLQYFPKDSQLLEMYNKLD